MNICKFLLASTVLLVAGCSAEVVKTDTIELEDERGEKIIVDLDEKTLVIALGTWCPACQEFYAALQDPSLSDVIDSLKVIYVFDSDEWPEHETRVRQAFGEAGKDAEEVEGFLSDLRNQAQGAAVVDPRFLQAIVGTVYFVPSNGDLKFDNGVPSVYLISSNEFESHPGQWLSENTGLSQNAILEAISKVSE